MTYLPHPSPNFNDRKDGKKPELVVIHFTGMDSTAAALERLCDPQAEVSAHYLIDEEGNIYHLVDEDKRAWHAGVSGWNGQEDINSVSIGIELSNRNGNAYPPKQIFALALLCKDIMHRHNIPPENVVGHSDIAPDRKDDPGAHFPWKMLSRHGIGKWPRPNLRDRFNAAAAAKKPQKLRALFAKAGYPTKSATTEQLVAAFQQRYEPAVYAGKGVPGKATARTVAKLRALARANAARRKRKTG